MLILLPFIRKNFETKFAEVKQGFWLSGILVSQTTNTVVAYCELGSRYFAIKVWVKFQVNTGKSKSISTRGWQVSSQVPSLKHWISSLFFNFYSMFRVNKKPCFLLQIFIWTSNETSATELRKWWKFFFYWTWTSMLFSLI